MAIRELPPVETLRQMFNYDASSGKVYWRERTPDSFIEPRTKTQAFCDGWNKRFKGKEAGSIGRNGYFSLTVCNKKYLLHRIAWKIAIGIDPLDAEIDHANTIPSDNRLCNLRIATSSDNSKNTKKHKDNVSGFKGVTYNKKTNRFFARIYFNRKTIHLGTFNSAVEAHAAYGAASEKYYGAFARAA